MMVHLASINVWKTPLLGGSYRPTCAKSNSQQCGLQGRLLAEASYHSIMQAEVQRQLHVL